MKGLKTEYNELPNMLTNDVEKLEQDALPHLQNKNNLWEPF
jgi:hypothetical protein